MKTKETVNAQLLPATFGQGRFFQKKALNAENKRCGYHNNHGRPTTTIITIINRRD